MRTVAEPEVLAVLRERLDRLTPDSRRRWGTLTPHEMLCHLGDSHEMVLLTRPRPRPVRPRRCTGRKLLALWSPLPWPPGWKTNPHQDPKRDGTRPGVFDADRLRAIRSMERLAAAGEGTLEVAHGFFGRMSTADWQRWTFKHVHHHLRQFGL